MDASSTAIGGVLSQVQKGSEKVIELSVTKGRAQLFHSGARGFSSSLRNPRILSLPLWISIYNFN